MLDRVAANAFALLAIGVACAANLIVACDGQGVQGKPPAPAHEVLRLPAGWQLNRGMMAPMRTELAVSPDGSSVVFSASPDGTMTKSRLYRRFLDRSQAVIVRGTPEGVCAPTFSPDGKWIAYWAADKLYKVPADGGAPARICDLQFRPFGTSWAADGRIVFGTEAAGLSSVRADGGTPRTLTTPDGDTEQTHRLPHVLPDGKSLLFTAMPSTDGLEARLEWLSLETGQRTLLIEDAADGQYLPTGDLVFVRRGALMAVPFDLARLQVKGSPVTVVPRLMHAFNNILPEWNSGAGQYSVSNSGILVWAAGGLIPDYTSELYWVDRSGRAVLWSAFGTKAVQGFRISPDGRRLLYCTIGLDRGVFVYDIQRNTTARLTADERPFYAAPLWTPDARRALFSWEEKGARPGLSGLNIWWVAADGRGKPTQLLRSALELRASSWTRDGRYLAFVEGYGTQDVKVLRMADRQVTAFAASKGSEAFPEFSPDGRWVAFVSNETGRNEVYVRSFPDGKKTMQLTSAGGVQPLWAPEGGELFYFDVGFKKLMRVKISAGQTPSAGSPQKVFDGFGTFGSQTVRVYDVTPDGQHLLVQKPVFSPVQVTELNVERRWFDRLKRTGVPAS